MLGKHTAKLSQDCVRNHTFLNSLSRGLTTMRYWGKKQVNLMYVFNPK